MKVLAALFLIIMCSCGQYKNDGQASPPREPPLIEAPCPPDQCLK